ncbi:monovalent cation/H+ antiporter complex subunit F [Howardella ureilytica]|nr:monovalent cation/H+ antiporter complex subunit F [Lachnospiraceae bacterium]MDY2956811.1 monovalent cation/H+ antiporter complex subunit F [Lachnospiraceae bacterium]
MIEKTLYSDIFLLICMFAMAAMLLMLLIRAIRGPRYTDRILAGNMISTNTMAFICLLAIFLHEDFIFDVAVIYAVLGFIAVVVLSKIIVAKEKKHRLRGDEKSRVVNVNREEDDD